MAWVGRRATTSPAVRAALMSPPSASAVAPRSTARRLTARSLPARPFAPLSIGKRAHSWRTRAAHVRNATWRPPTRPTAARANHLVAQERQAAAEAAEAAAAAAIPLALRRRRARACRRRNWRAAAWRTRSARRAPQARPYAFNGRSETASKSSGLHCGFESRVARGWECTKATLEAAFRDRRASHSRPTDR